MDITPQDNAQQSISDDQELAKALAGVVPGVSEPAPLPTPPSEAPAPEATSEPSSVTAAAISPSQPSSNPEPSTQAPSSSANGSLETIKKDALQELRPLIDKVDLPAEEKFDTYLMLLRSTDDASLIAPAHDAALAITDEKRKASALLDVIKEIDYLSQPKQAQ